MHWLLLKKYPYIINRNNKQNIWNEDNKILQIEIDLNWLQRYIYKKSIYYSTLR